MSSITDYPTYFNSSPGSKSESQASKKRNPKLLLNIAGFSLLISGAGTIILIVLKGRPISTISLGQCIFFYFVPALSILLGLAGIFSHITLSTKRSKESNGKKYLCFYVFLSVVSILSYISMSAYLVLKLTGNNAIFISNSQLQKVGHSWIFQDLFSNCKVAPDKSCSCLHSNYWIKMSNKICESFMNHRIKQQQITQSFTNIWAIVIALLVVQTLIALVGTLHAMKAKSNKIRRHGWTTPARSLSVSNYPIAHNLYGTAYQNESEHLYEMLPSKSDRGNSYDLPLCNHGLPSPPINAVNSSRNHWSQRDTCDGLCHAGTMQTSTFHNNAPCYHNNGCCQSYIRCSRDSQPTSQPYDILPPPRTVSQNIQ